MHRIGVPEFDQLSDGDKSVIQDYFLIEESPASGVVIYLLIMLGIGAPGLGLLGYVMFIPATSGLSFILSLAAAILITFGLLFVANSVAIQLLKKLTHHRFVSFLQDQGIADLLSKAHQVVDE